MTNCTLNLTSLLLAFASAHKT